MESTKALEPGRFSRSCFAKSTEITSSWNNDVSVAHHTRIIRLPACLNSMLPGNLKWCPFRWHNLHSVLTTSSSTIRNSGEHIVRATHATEVVGSYVLRANASSSYIMLHPSDSASINLLLCWHMLTLSKKKQKVFRSFPMLPGENQTHCTRARKAME